MSWNNNKNSFGKLPKMKEMPEYSDNNLDSMPSLKTSSFMPNDRLASPARLAAPKEPTLLGGTDKDPNASTKQRMFRKLAGLIGPKKSI